MNIGQLSEDRLVAQLTKRFARSAAVKVGIGDDCAAVTGPASGQWLLLKTDCVVEGVHYLSGTSGRKVGWKALARPLSDIAAMGGLPRQALVTVAISRQKSVRYLDGIFAGIDRIARLFDVHVVGGETSQSPGRTSFPFACQGWWRKGGALPAPEADPATGCMSRDDSAVHCMGSIWRSRRECWKRGG